MCTETCWRLLCPGLFQAGPLARRACDSVVPAGNFQHLTCVTSLHPIISKEIWLPGNMKSSNIVYSFFGNNKSLINSFDVSTYYEPEKYCCTPCVLCDSD